MRVFDGAAGSELKVGSCLGLSTAMKTYRIAWLGFPDALTFRLFGELIIYRIYLDSWI